MTWWHAAVALVAFPLAVFTARLFAYVLAYGWTRGQLDAFARYSKSRLENEKFKKETTNGTR